MHDASEPTAPGSAPLLILSQVVGVLSDDTWHDRAHAAEAKGQLETVRITPDDAPRRRMRLVTDRGRDVALALARDADLCDGSVLHAADDLMIVVRIDHGPRLRLVPADFVSALRLGYFCGNLHWKADFDGDAIEIHMNGPEEAFRARLADAEKLCVFTVDRREPPE